MKRFRFLDAVRGLTLISMTAYHAIWDAAEFLSFGADPQSTLWGKAWQMSICCMFILLSGFCCLMGGRRLRRGLVVFLCGCAVTAVTTLFMPEQRIVFGILTLLGTCMALCAALKGLVEKCPPRIGLPACIALFALSFYGAPQICGRLKANLFTAYLGFPPPDFYSADYFPLVPWAFLFFAGVFLYRAEKERNMKDLPEWPPLPPIEWLGRHSLEVYLLHQPLLFLIFEAAGRILK